MSKVSEKQRRRRSEIIEELIPLIASVPFEKLSVNDICEAAGISVGSFYHYFEKKSDILVGLLGLIDGYVETELAPKLERLAPLEALGLFAREWAAYVEAHGIERSRLISSVAPANTDLNGRPRSSLALLESIMAAGQAEGSILPSPAPGELAELYLLALRAVTTDWSRNDGSYAIGGRMEDFMELWLRGIAAR